MAKFSVSTPTEPRNEGGKGSFSDQTKITDLEGDALVVLGVETVEHGAERALASAAQHLVCTMTRKMKGDEQSEMGAKTSERERPR